MVYKLLPALLPSLSFTLTNGSSLTIHTSFSSVILLILFVGHNIFAVEIHPPPTSPSSFYPYFLSFFLFNLIYWEWCWLFILLPSVLHMCADAGYLRWTSQVPLMGTIESNLTKEYVCSHQSYRTLIQVHPVIAIQKYFLSRRMSRLRMWVVLLIRSQRHWRIPWRSSPIPPPYATSWVNDLIRTLTTPPFLEYQVQKPHLQSHADRPKHNNSPVFSLPSVICPHTLTNISTRFGIDRVDSTRTRRMDVNR